MHNIRTAAVIGAGVMGAGIAANLAEAGLQVIVLDLDALQAQQGLDREIRNGGFADPASRARVRSASTVTDLPLIAEADWIIEAASERIEVKRGLFRAIDRFRKPGSIVSSNTSTIRLSDLTADVPPQFARDFLITHFFTPPRLMRLLEIVAGPDTSAETIQSIREFAELHLGKVIVAARDTPGFIANRIGNFWIAAALHEAIDGQLSIEDADAVLGRPFGMPSGVFAFLDVVGIDLVPAAWASLSAALPADDPLQQYLAPPPLIVGMIAEGRIGRKAGAGFMRKSAGGLEVLDLVTGAYRPARPAAPAALAGGTTDLRAIIEHDSECGRFADRVICATLGYAASLIPDVAETPELADCAMRYGYGWRAGPFELIDKLGPAWLADRLQRVPLLLQRAVGAGSFYRLVDEHLFCLDPVGLHRVDRPELLR